MAKGGKGMLSSVEQVFVGREEIRAPLKTPAWEANSTHAWRIISEMSRATEITTSRPGDVTNARDSLKIHSKQCWIW